MPKDLVSVNLIICERVLAEHSGVLSAIRMVDIFFVDPATVGPDAEERVSMQVLLVARFPAGTVGQYNVEFKLVRPNQEPVSMGGVRPAPVEIQIPDAPTGFATVMTAAVKQKQMGTHYFVAYIDGDEVAKAAFTLQPPLTQQAE